MWCYGSYQTAYDEMLKTVKPKIEFFKGVPDDLSECINPSQNNVLIIDDLMAKAGDDKSVTDLFTKGSHHMNLSIIYIVQNIFPKGRERRTIRINAHYMFVFKNPRDPSQINSLGRQLYPTHPRCLGEAYQNATKEPHTYLMVDLKQQTPEALWLCMGILPKDESYVYVPKHV